MCHLCTIPPKLPALHTFTSARSAFDACIKMSAFKAANRDREAWFDGLTQEQARQWSYEGCNAIVPQIEETMALMDAELPTLSIEHTMGIAGYCPDIPLFLSSDPECMRSVHYDAAATGAINIAVCLESGCRQCDNINCLCEPIDANSVKLRGAAVLSLVARLSAIRPVNLIALHTVHGHTLESETDKQFFYRRRHRDYQSTAALAVQINTAPLDLASAGFVLCNVGFARAVLYGLHVRGQKARKTSVSGAPAAGLTFAAILDDDGRRVNVRDMTGDKEMESRYCQGIRRMLGWDAADSLIVPPTQEHMSSAEDAIAWVKDRLAVLMPAEA